MGSLLYWTGMAAVAVSALTGVLDAGHKRMDIVGVVMVGCRLSAYQIDQSQSLVKGGAAARSGMNMDLHSDIRLLTLRGRLPAEIGPVVEVIFGAVETSSTQPLYSVVGASIAVCLFNLSSGLVGMCHVMLPAKFGHHRDDAMLKADSSLDALYNRLWDKDGEQGGGTPHMRAKLFGGAELEQDDLSFSDGKQSTIFTRNWLRTRSIPILCESIGGPKRREIVLLPGTGQVFCKQVSMPSEFLQLERADMFAAAAPLNKVELF